MFYPLRFIAKTFAFFAVKKFNRKVRKEKIRQERQGKNAGFYPFISISTTIFHFAQMTKAKIYQLVFL
jgi:predicted transcriptional regulator